MRIDGVVVNEETGERYLLNNGIVTKRLGSDPDADAATPCQCTRNQILRPEFRNLNLLAAPARPPQEPLVMPTMNFGDDHGDTFIEYQPSMESPFIEYAEPSESDIPINTRKRLAQQQGHKQQPLMPPTLEI